MFVYFSWLLISHMVLLSRQDNSMGLNIDTGNWPSQWPPSPVGWPGCSWCVLTPGPRPPPLWCLLVHPVAHSASAQNAPGAAWFAVSNIYKQYKYYHTANIRIPSPQQNDTKQLIMNIRQLPIVYSRHGKHDRVRCFWLDFSSTTTSFTISKYYLNICLVVMYCMYLYWIDISCRISLSYYVLMLS